MDKNKVTEIHMAKAGDEKPRDRVQVDMLQSKIPKRNLRNMDELTKRFAEIHQLLHNEVDCWLSTMKNENIKQRIMYEVGEGTKYLELALIRLSRGINHVEYTEDKNG